MLKCNGQRMAIGTRGVSGVPVQRPVGQEYVLETETVITLSLVTGARPVAETHQTSRHATLRRAPP